MFDPIENSEIKMGSDRSFGFVFSCVFLIVSAWPILFGEVLRIWPLPIAMVFGVIAIVRPTILNPLNRLWFLFGLLLGKIMTPLVMSLVFLVTVIPTGAIMRLLGKDPLNRKIDRTASSYWIERQDRVGSMKNQF